jgi:hypothetical protein
MFKSGDKAEVVSEDRNNHIFKVGDIVTVVQESTGIGLINFKNSSGLIQALWKEEVKPVSKEYIEMRGVKQEPMRESTEERLETIKDNINPSHYKGSKFECIDVIEEVTKNLEGVQAVCTGNVIKYTYRWKSKNGLEDLKKAQWYLTKLIKTLEN